MGTEYLLAGTRNVSFGEVRFEKFPSGMKSDMEDDIVTGICFYSFTNQSGMKVQT